MINSAVSKYLYNNFYSVRLGGKLIRRQLYEVYNEVCTYTSAYIHTRDYDSLI